MGVYVVFVAGGIASGKSTVSRRLQRLGEARIDLDEVSRAVLMPGSPVLTEVAAEFGQDLLSPATGELDRAALAARAFASPEAIARLEAIELPAIQSELASRIEHARGAWEVTHACAVEVQLLDKAIASGMIDLADEVIAVTCPLEIRRERAILRGMDGEDFDRRVANQPTDAFLEEHADVVFDNSQGEDVLIGRTDKWWERKMRHGWRNFGAAQ